jgi:hypothetical protein
MDRPASPLFVRACTGQDMETQILPGDLFDFDLEVEPLLEVLVGKSIHVAMLELMQEEELEAILAKYLRQTQYGKVFKQNTLLAFKVLNRFSQENNIRVEDADVVFREYSS